MVTVSIVAGTAATAICADLRSQNSRDEVDAMKALGCNPIQRLVTPLIVVVSVTLLASRSLHGSNGNVNLSG